MSSQYATALALFNSTFSAQLNAQLVRHPSGLLRPSGQPLPSGPQSNAQIGKGANDCIAMTKKSFAKMAEELDWTSKDIAKFGESIMHMAAVKKEQEASV